MSGAATGEAPRAWERCDPKEVATLKARAAMAGIALYVIEDDRGAQVFVLTVWARTHHLGSVEDVERFIRGVGGPKA